MQAWAPAADMVPDRHLEQVVDCTAAGDGVGFRPRGYAITFGTITLRNASGDERRVIVDIAGRMRVQ